MVSLYNMKNCDIARSFRCFCQEDYVMAYTPVCSKGKPVEQEKTAFYNFWWSPEDMVRKAYIMRRTSWHRSGLSNSGCFPQPYGYIFHFSPTEMSSIDLFMVQAEVILHMGGLQCTHRHAHWGLIMVRFYLSTIIDAMQAKSINIACCQSVLLMLKCPVRSGTLCLPSQKPVECAYFVYEC